ncbi:MAG: excinuclease ABC subunit UvrA [Kiritimatiellae bacterium]|nr:excinuclease ABC subunit UvrA [Kiritimatiellia bacterium]
MDSITITGAKEHNLRNVDVVIPRNSLTVVTGLSGSGKSSLAFDTLYAEGQRRYVESLSAYARQFLDRLSKPDVEHIEGLSPAISIEQHTTGGNPRSVVATVTEIHDYLRVLYASAATAHCPECGRPVEKQSADEIVDSILSGKNDGCRAIIYASVVKGKKGRHEDVLSRLAADGFVRARIDGELRMLDEGVELDRKKAHTIEALVDRLVLPCDRARLADSVELALKTGGGSLVLERFSPDGKSLGETVMSELNACVHCGISFDTLKPRSFSFNSPFGACPHCAGLGSIYYFDENLVVPDKTLPLEEAVHPWRRLGGQMAILYHKELLARIAKQYKVKLSTPYSQLPKAFRYGLMHGFKDDLVLPWRREDRPFEGVLEALRRKRDEIEDDEVRAKYDAYQSFKTCPECGGARLRPESRAARVAGRTIVEVMAMPAKEALVFFKSLEDLPAKGGRFAGLGDIIAEIVRRLRFLVDVGLEYLSLDRPSATLSGGEMQRIRLATQIGSGLTGVLYVLDEPTIGLHPRDNERLIGTLKGLRDRGNTVVIVEHDAEMMRAADWIVDLGPGAGREGGKVMYQGPYEGLLRARSLTADYLSGRKTVASVASGEAKKSFSRFLTVHGAKEHNLKNVTARFPVGAFTVVTGVSGSGKSTLVDETLKRALMKKFYGAKAEAGRHSKITGAENFDKVIEIDQSPIGRTPRSNPATYVGFFSDIRDLFAATPAAKARGYTPGRFSFNVKGGRCEVCGGDGSRKLEMSFLPDVYVTCEQCAGRRFNAETLDVKYDGRSIADVLEMTVDEALGFFGKVPSLRRKLALLSDVGLGYIALGQSATTLSGGEAQRIKLATELSRRSTGRTLYLLDEPTTGLHFDDVAKLMRILLALRDQGNTVVVIEHNTDVIGLADWIVDLGPGGGSLGGELVAEGPPSLVRSSPRSVTARFI